MTKVIRFRLSYSHIIHIQLYTETYKCGNIINNVDERTLFFRKYTSHPLFERVAKGLWKNCVWEVSLRLTDCNILTPSSSGHQHFFLILLGCSTEVPRAQALCLELVLTASNYNSNSNKLIPTLWLQLTVATGYIIVFVHLLPVGVAIALNSTHPRSMLYLDIFDWMHLFLDWRLGRRLICYNHPIIFFQNFTCEIFLRVRLHPPHTQILQILPQDNNSRKKYKKKLPEPQRKKKILIWRRPSRYVTLARLLSKFVLLSLRGWLSWHVCIKVQYGCIFHSPKTTGPSVIPWRISKP